MAWQEIDIGTTADDGTGDTLRVAFDKTNDNFIESGTWTPVLRGDSVAGTQTYSTQNGRYNALGRTVNAFFDIELSAFDGATSGDMEISGLPFDNLANIFGIVSFGIINFINLATNYTAVSARVPTTLSTIILFEIGDNVASARLTEADFGNTSRLVGVAIYERAAP